MALACYVAALNSKMNFPPAYYGLGETFAKRAPNGFELARESYELALKHWPEYIDANIALGDLWARTRGDRSRAEVYFLSATRLRPDDALAWESLAQNQVEDGRLDNALKTYDGAIERIRESPGLYFGRGTVHQKKENFQACVNDAEHALKIASEFGQAYHLLALCSSEMIGPDSPSATDLEMYFRQAIRFEPEFAAHFLDFAWFLYNDGRLREARDVLDKALDNPLSDEERTKFEHDAREFEQFVAHMSKKGEL